MNFNKLTQESQQQRQIRVEEARIRYQQNRNQESQQERQMRLETKRTRTQQNRNQESDYERQARLFRDRNRHSNRNRNRRHSISDIKYFINGNIDDFDEKVEPYYLGKMDVSCMHCNAQMFEDEKLKSSSKNIKKFGLCCFEGKNSYSTIRRSTKFFKRIR